MIHVMNPYQLSTSMFRLAAYTWENQVKMMQAFGQLATCSNPMMVSRAAILKRSTPPEPTAKPASKPRAKAAPKPATRKAVRKPAVVKSTTAPKAVSPAKSADTPEAKKYRAPSKPPAMPASKAAE